jgi:hypothetical protein
MYSDPTDTSIYCLPHCILTFFDVKEGILTVPEGPGPFPAVLLIAGSGEIDRDGIVKKVKLLPTPIKNRQS